jgi:hypothetical protein
MHFTVELVITCLQGELSDMDDIKAQIRKAVLEDPEGWVDKIELIDIRPCQ